jgi:hypothetical protein
MTEPPSASTTLDYGNSYAALPRGHRPNLRTYPCHGVSLPNEHDQKAKSVVNVDESCAGRNVTRLLLLL